jgi:hypothetical protein
VGFGVLDDLKAAGYAVTGVTAASNPIETDRYPNKRSELWVVTAEMARVGEIDVSRLSADWQDELGRQAKSAVQSGRTRASCGRSEGQAEGEARALTRFV